MYHNFSYSILLLLIIFDSVSSHIIIPNIEQQTLDVYIPQINYNTLDYNSTDFQEKNNRINLIIFSLLFVRIVNNFN